MGKLLRSLSRWVLLLAGFCLGAAISYFNWTPVTFDYLAGQAELPLIALLLAAFLSGLAVMGLLNLGRTWLLKRDSRKLQNRLNLAETELKNLRNIEWAAPGAKALTPPPAPPAVPLSPASRARDGGLAARDSH